jgi:hypothetical protein
MRSASLFSLLLLLVPACVADNADKLGAAGESCHADQDCREPLYCDGGVCGDGSEQACRTDADCGSGRWCSDGGCRADSTNNGSANNGSNNGRNNGGFNNGRNNGGFNNGRNNGGFNNGENNGGFNNGRPNNGIPPDPDPDPDPTDPFDQPCRDLCDTLDSCEFDLGPDCEEQCRDIGLGPDEISCLSGLSCEDLETGGPCIDNGPGPMCGDGVCERGERRSCPEDCDEEEDLQRCFEACDFITSCEEFVERCGPDVTDEIRELCFEACSDPEAREQIAQAGQFSCEQVVPLAIDGFGLGDVCN